MRRSERFARGAGRFEMRLFRLGATSYVFPADLVTNARQLAGIADDMELVLFETQAHGSNFPSPAEVKALNEIGQTQNLTFTIHLPRDMNCSDALALDQNRRVIALTRPLSPYAYVMHLDGAIFLRDTSAATIQHWQEDARRAILQVVDWVGDATRVCVENVESWNPTYFETIVLETGVSRCIDVGHLWKDGRDPLAHLDAHLHQTRVIHLHGLKGRDHQSLKHMSHAQLLPVITTLVRKKYSGVLTCEVFGEQDFFSSRDALLKLWMNLSDATL